MSLDVEREQAIQVLCRQFAHDQLSTQELESRIDAVYRAASVDELRALVGDLPAVIPADGAAPLADYGPPSYTQPEQTVRAIFASVKKRGEWEPAELTHAKAVFSNIELDFREARLSPDITTVKVDALFSAVKIIVPPGLRVECDGSAVFGEFSHKTFLGAEPGSNAPTLRIVGRVAFGEVKIVMRMPNENAIQALKREWTR